MNTESSRKMISSTAQAFHGHNGNNWIIAHAN
jgi:hypothetical protein